MFIVLSLHGFILETRLIDNCVFLSDTMKSFSVQILIRFVSEADVDHLRPYWQFKSQEVSSQRW